MINEFKDANNVVKANWDLPYQFIDAFSESLDSEAKDTIKKHIFKAKSGVIPKDMVGF